MSRIGKKPVTLRASPPRSAARPSKVKGPKGHPFLHRGRRRHHPKHRRRSVKVTPRGLSKRARQQWGMTRSMIENLVTGVSTGFKKELEIQGVGYRAAMQGNILKLSLGYSHEVNFEVPKGVTVTTPKQTEIVVEGIDQQLVGQVAANIREWRSRSPTRARASATRVSSSSARKARRSKGRKMANKRELFLKRRLRVRNKIKATADGRLRLSVHRSSKNISVQLIDDVKGVTVAAASSLEKDLGVVGKNNVEAAAKIGAAIAERAKKAGVEECYFDRGGFLFHGKIKALADAAREGGLKF
jgi:ribosomal protein L18